MRRRAHLYKFRQGWQSENLARFLLSEFAFIAQPSTVADDIGSDFYCTLFQKEKTKGDSHLIPKNSFVIQVKSSDRKINLSSKAELLNKLEVPFFIGVVDRTKLSLRIFSGLGLHLLFAMWGVPDKLRAVLVKRVIKGDYFKAPSLGKQYHTILLPLIGQVRARNLGPDSEKISNLLSRECLLIHRNISSIRTNHFVLTFGKNDRRVFAGIGTVEEFRKNFALRFAEVFYNLEWIFLNNKPQFSHAEYSAYVESWEKIRRYCALRERKAVDKMLRRLMRIIKSGN